MPQRRPHIFFLGPFSRASSALVCAAFSAFVLTLCVLGGIQFKHRVEREVYRETENIAQVLMADFDDDAATADAILTRLADDIPEGLVSQSHETELHELLKRFSLQPSMIGPAILDADGTLIATARVNSVPRISFKDRNIFRAHADAPGQARLYISTPTRGALTNEWAIQFSRPMRDKEGRFKGVVLLSYRLSHFVRLYEKLKLSDRGLAGLTGKDGVVRIRLLNGEIGYGEQVARIPLVYNRFIAGETAGRFQGRSTLDNVTRIGTFVSSPVTPFYVVVGYDGDFLRAQYIGFFYVLALCWFAVTATMIAAAAFIYWREHSRLEVINAAVAERQKISADMHDSIGASLAALLAYFTTENVNIADVKRRIGEILTELRFLVDTTHAEEADIHLLLANVRHRMAMGFELAGVDLRWRIGDLPTVPALTAHDALALKLVLMETLSNVLHHSRAKTAAVSADYDRDASVIVIAVKDDGRGFRPDEVLGGRGLTSMRGRIAGISIGGTLSISSNPDDGTTVRIELKVPSST
jgi:signal transduction histidine kinase